MEIFCKAKLFSSFIIFVFTIIFGQIVLNSWENTVAPFPLLSPKDKNVSGCFYFRKRKSADIYEKYLFLVFLGATDRYSVTPSW